MEFEYPNKLIKRDQKRCEVSDVEQKEFDEKTLREGDVEFLDEQIGFGSSNIIKLCEIKDYGKAIFKPQKEERSSRTEVECGTFYKREVAAYLVDKALEFELVPPTVVREIDEEIGSLQKYIDGTEMYYDALKTEDDFKRYEKEFIKMWIFDYIIWNSDRSNSNHLMKEGSVCAIDNGLSFGNDTLRQLAGRFTFDAKTPQDILEKIENFLSDEDKIKDLKNKLREFIPVQEINACIGRMKNIQELISSGTIPLSKKDQLTFE